VKLHNANFERSKLGMTFHGIRRNYSENTDKNCGNVIIFSSHPPRQNCS